MPKRQLGEEVTDLPFKRGRSDISFSAPENSLSFSHISRLSDEILLNIFERLCLEQLLLCQRVSHRWHKISTDPELWKRLYFVRYVKPRLAHLRSRRHIASQEWWMTETTQNESGGRKDWKHLFKVRHNWHKGRCAISEMDISDPVSTLENFQISKMGSFWDEPQVSSSPPLVQFDGKIFVSVDKEAGLRAWDITQIEHGERKVVGNRKFRGYEEGWMLGTPSALAMDGDEVNPNIIVGFESGGAMILQLHPMGASDCREHGFWVRFVLRPLRRRARFYTSHIPILTS